MNGSPSTLCAACVVEPHVVGVFVREAFVEVGIALELFLCAWWFRCMRAALAPVFDETLLWCLQGLCLCLNRPCLIYERV